MTYLCKDCSYRGKVGGQFGECPACGSFNLVRNLGTREEKPPPSRWRAVLMVLLWGCLITLVTWKLIQ